MQRVSRLVRTVSLLSLRQLVVDSATPSIRTFIRPNFIRNLSLSFTNMAYKAVERGCVNTQSYRVFITDADGNVVSPFHDIPLFCNAETKECNMVVEIPRWSNHKMEISTTEKMNPIKQDVKKGKVRFVKNCFPHHGYIWNYGALPQTWEDTDHTEPETGTKGDNDPVDVCEIGQTVHARGSIIQVKILGIMCLIDEGETDWKVICIDVKDPLAPLLNDIDDVEKEMPGFLKATEEWFKVYKIPDGKVENKFAFNGQAKNRAYALRVIEETHGQWKKLVSNADDVQKGDLDCQNTKVGGSPQRIEQSAAQAALNEAPAFGAPAPLPADVDKWHYIPPAALL